MTATRSRLDLLRIAHARHGPLPVKTEDGSVDFRPRKGAASVEWHPGDYGHAVSDADALVADGFLERRTYAPDGRVRYAITVRGLKAIDAWPAHLDETCIRQADAWLH